MDCWMGWMDGLHVVSKVSGESCGHGNLQYPFENVPEENRLIC